MLKSMKLGGNVVLTASPRWIWLREESLFEVCLMPKEDPFSKSSLRYGFECLKRQGTDIGGA